MADFTVYGTPLSPFVRKVEAVLGLTGTAYDFETVSIMDLPDWFLEISPARRIPVLRDTRIASEGVAGTIADSSAICVFLNAELEAGLYGRTPFDAGRASWLEEYADTEVAAPLGFGVFRSIVFPLMAGKPSDLDTARKTLQQKMPRHFDYLEAALDGNEFFVGGLFSIADIAIGSQLTQLDMIAGPPDPNRWPGLARHTAAMKTRPGFAENLATCGKILHRILPAKVDLSGG